MTVKNAAVQKTAKTAADALPKGPKLTDTKARLAFVTKEATDPAQLSNRKELVVFHGLNPSGLLAQATAAKVEDEHTAFVAKFATSKGWPKASDLKAALAAIEKAVK